MSISFSFFAERFAAYRAPASLLVKCVLPCAGGPASESKQTPAFGFSRASRGIASTRGVRTALVNLVGLLGLVGFAGLTGFAAFPSSPALAADLSTLPSCQADLTDRIGPQALPSLREVASDGSSPESLTPLRTKRSGEIVLYVDSRMPEAVLLTLARSAERLGATVAVTGLPVKPRETNPAFRKEALETSDVLNAEGVLPRDRFELGNLAALVRAGLNVSVNPLPWEAVERSLNANRAPEDRVSLPMPALVAILGNALEVLPGAVDPVYGAARLAQRARDRGVRAYLHEHLRERGLSVHEAEP